MLLGIREFREPKLPKTYSKLIVGATTVVKGTLCQPMPNLRTRANQPAIATPAPTCGANSIPIAG
jgi:hypothetical protein